MTQKTIFDDLRARDVVVDIDGERITLHGNATGNKKQKGPLAGRTFGLLVAPEFSDFQAYYLAEYLSEFGADVRFIGAEGAYWKYTRPNDRDKGLQGMWGMSLNPVPVLRNSRCSYVTVENASVDEYDAIVVLGGHSADILTVSPQALDFLAKCAQAGCVLGAVGEGCLPLISKRLIDGRRCTGNRIVSYMLERLGEYTGRPVVSDGKLVTCRDTEFCGEFARALVRAFDPEFEDTYKGSLVGRRIVLVAGEDFEDIELVAPTLELLHRGASLTLATFSPPLRSRPPMLGVDVVMGNFGVSVPFQDIPGDRYEIRPLAEIGADEFDMVMIPGAFCPWNMVAAATPVDWLRSMHEEGRLIAAICHGAIPLSAADIVRDKHVAGVEAVRDHVAIMGGTYHQEASAIIDGNIVTGRVPPDVPEFVDAMTAALL
ncbi:MAG: DJ-1/PfpI family protein [Spirochaetota bacterium]